MKNIIFLGLIALFLSCNTKKEKPVNSNMQKKEFVKEIQQFQYELNIHYSTANESPLTPEDLKDFRQLSFFDINEDFKVTASFIETPDSEVFEMTTTSDRKPLYRIYGRASFSIEGKEYTLNLYQNQQFMNTSLYGKSLFLPFTDLTNSVSSYGGGRYIDVKMPVANATSVVIDFNKAYNPYCAYNIKYSCPIVPSGNNVAVKIEAGVKRFKDH
ncbi:MAG: DUF1684 domain-containing protein [Flavobacteriaceae bacterium]|nr:DUF1684 domain-containing protein [Flavobacteriaceae bacterium]